MRRRDLSLTIALCASLVMHALGFFAVVSEEVRRLVTELHHPAIDRTELAIVDPKKPESPMDHALPEPPEPEILQGEKGGNGKATDSVDGEQLMQAREAPEVQAALARTQGALGDGAAAGGARPAAPRKPIDQLLAQAAQPAAPTLFGPPADPNAPFGLPIAPAPQQMPPLIFREPSKVIGVKVAAPDASPTTRSAVAMLDSPATRPVDKAPTSKPVNLPLDVATVDSKVTDAAATKPVQVAMNEPRPRAPEGALPSTTQPVDMKMPTTMPLTPPPRNLTAVASVEQIAHPVDPSPPAVATASGTGRPSGDFGNKSESESDAFGESEPLVYRDGKVVARDGEHVKTVKPKLTEAGIQALLGMQDRRVVLAAHIDYDGKVTSVDYVRHSASNDVDLPSYLALYEWVFTPRKDADGKPRRDVQIVEFVWR